MVKEGQSKRAKDTLMMRRIGVGNFSEYLAFRHRNGRSVGGLDWGILSDAVEDGMGPRLGI